MEKKQNQVSDEFKNMIYEQYLSEDSLHIYCDSSLNKVLKQMAVASTFVGLGGIFVKQQYAYPPRDCLDKPIYGELKALQFALTHFEKYMMLNCNRVTIYSDVSDIESFLSNKINFKNSETLKKVQSDLILLNQKMMQKHPNITIDIHFLQRHHKANNPFHRSAHLAANKMLNKKVK